MPSRLVCALVAAGSWALAPTAGATRIFYDAIDLPDTGGGDLWQYRYTLGDVSLAADQGFAIEFALGLYAELEDPPPSAGPDWDVLVLQPDPGVPDDGVYDALALADGASLAGPFELRFVWLGGGTPGSQPFALNQFDPTGAFVAQLDAGFTEPLPEPGAFALVGLLAAGLAARSRR